MFSPAHLGEPETWTTSQDIIYEISHLNHYLLILPLTFLLQPENLLLDSQGNLKISDFGLSALPAEVRFEYVVIVSSIRIIIINLCVCRVSVSFEQPVELPTMLHQRGRGVITGATYPFFPSFCRLWQCYLTYMHIYHCFILCWWCGLGTESQRLQWCFGGCMVMWGHPICTDGWIPPI